MSATESTPANESREVRLRRLIMRSHRRGMKEMDVVLGRYADQNLDRLDAASLDAYEALIAENDQDLFRWVSGAAPLPPEHQGALQSILSYLERK